ncbi:MAG: peroxiredoxin [Actinomycetaceae bacterium]|nr:peroxiredoxin [Actinomycetaceae bacterium]
MALLSIGDTFPEFNLVAVKPGKLTLIDAYEHLDYFENITHEPTKSNQWTVVFFWPKNFSIVCPTEITSFAKHYNEFEKLNTRIIGISTDNEYSTFAWRRTNSELNSVPFPLACDMDHSLSLACGAMGKNGVCDRATFILDPENVIKFVSVTATNVGRSIPEILRQIEALQTNQFCIADWNTGDQTINPLDMMKDY